jgi:glycosyltransferase involved in cell wall biosynthesis
MNSNPDRRLKIALFSDSALPVLNGVSVSIEALVTNLRQMGHSVHIFTASHFGYRDPDPNTYRFPAISTPWTRGYPLAYPPFYPMIRHFRKHSFDIIHTHTPFTVGFVGLRWGESHEIPVVSTYHTLYDKYAHYSPFFPKRYVRYKIAKHTNFYYNSTNHVIVPSDAAQRWLRRHSVRTPISVIPTGIGQGTSIVRAEARAILGVNPDQRMLLYVGRIAREKNMEMLFRAVSRAFDSDPSLVFWLVGDGPMRSECVDLARDLGIGDRVRFVGFIPRNEVDMYYAAADLFVFASMTETQGLVVGEAMSYGLPPVVVSGGGASAAVQDGENGIIVGNDAQALSSAILQILNHDVAYTRISEAARKSMRGQTVSAMAQKVVDVYDQVLGGTARVVSPVR